MGAEAHSEDVGAETGAFVGAFAVGGARLEGHAHSSSEDGAVVAVGHVLEGAVAVTVALQVRENNGKEIFRVAHRNSFSDIDAGSRGISHRREQTQHLECN